MNGSGAGDEDLVAEALAVARAERWSGSAPGPGGGGPGDRGRLVPEQRARGVLVRGLLGAMGAVLVAAVLGGLVAGAGMAAWCGVEWIVARRRSGRRDDVWRVSGDGDCS